MGDIVTDHFGKTADGRPVLIDYGFTTGVAEGYYRSDSYNSYGSPPPSSIMSQDEEEDIGYEDGLDALDLARIENMRNRPKSPSRVSKSRASGT